MLRPGPGRSSRVSVAKSLSLLGQNILGLVGPTTTRRRGDLDVTVGQAPDHRAIQKASFPRWRRQCVGAFSPYLCATSSSQSGVP
jgi:hypothetical protein